MPVINSRRKIDKREIYYTDGVEFIWAAFNLKDLNAHVWLADDPLRQIVGVQCRECKVLITADNLRKTSKAKAIRTFSIGLLHKIKTMKGRKELFCR